MLACLSVCLLSLGCCCLLAWLLLPACLVSTSACFCLLCLLLWLLSFRFCLLSLAYFLVCLLARLLARLLAEARGNWLQNELCFPVRMLSRFTGGLGGPKWFKNRFFIVVFLSVFQDGRGKRFLCIFCVLRCIGWGVLF